MECEKAECDIYTDEGLSDYIEDDCISPIESGFMRGYLSAAGGD